MPYLTHGPCGIVRTGVPPHMRTICCSIWQSDKSHLAPPGEGDEVDKPPQPRSTGSPSSARLILGKFLAAEQISTLTTLCGRLAYRHASRGLIAPPTDQPWGTTWTSTKHMGGGGKVSPCAWHQGHPRYSSTRCPM